MNPAMKRLVKELAEINNESDSVIAAQPLHDNLFEWHFDFKGPENSPYSEGRYHGRIVFPADYPFAPPNISFLTPNGRWETGKKICLSVTGFHPELWQPAWSIRTILLALRDHMRTDDKASIGYLDYSEDARRELARKSLKWKCSACTSQDGTDSSGGSGRKLASPAPVREAGNAHNFMLVSAAVVAVLAAVFIMYHQQ